MAEETSDRSSVARKGDPPTSRIARRVPAYSRYIVTVPVVGLFTGAVALIALAGVSVVTTVGHILGGELDKKGAVLEFIEIADVFLLATVLYVMALGLYELFVDSGLVLPSWLVIRTLDDLKEKLVGVVVVVMAVLFLGMVISGGEGIALMYRGIGIASVIVSLGYFLGRKGGH